MRDHSKPMRLALRLFAHKKSPIYPIPAGEDDDPDKKAREDEDKEWGYVLFKEGEFWYWHGTRHRFRTSADPRTAGWYKWEQSTKVSAEHMSLLWECQHLHVGAAWRRHPQTTCRRNK